MNLKEKFKTALKTLYDYGITTGDIIIVILIIISWYIYIIPRRR